MLHTYCPTSANTLQASESIGMQKELSTSSLHQAERNASILTLLLNVAHLNANKPMKTHPAVWARSSQESQDFKGLLRSLQLCLSPLLLPVGGASHWKTRALRPMPPQGVVLGMEQDTSNTHGESPRALASGLFLFSLGNQQICKAQLSAWQDIQARLELLKFFLAPVQLLLALLRLLHKKSLAQTAFACLTRLLQFNE